MPTARLLRTGSLATNVVPGPGGYHWRFDPDDMESLLADFFRRDLWDVIEAPVLPSEIHLVRADESDVMTSAELERVRVASRNGRVFAHELHGGHWLHVDNPDGLIDLVVGHLV